MEHEHSHHEHHAQPTSNVRLAVAATLHCLLGCSIGEVLGLIIGTAADLHNAQTIALSVGLAFIFGYALSARPLLRAGMAAKQAFKLVLAADTLSIITMEITDNTVMAAVPGAMGAGLGNALFWFTMAVSLAIAFVVALPVNKFLLDRGKGHALVHEHHHAH
jgi:hypothetical protein